MIRRRKMIRAARLALIVVIIAAIINLAVAWVIAWRVNSEKIVFRPGPYFRFRNMSDGASWEGRFESGLLTDRMQISVLKVQTTQNSTTGSLTAFAAELPPYARAELLRWCKSVNQPDPESPFVIVVARGWPFTAFYLVKTPTRPSATTQPRDYYQVRGAWIARPATRRWQHAIEIPFLPVWPGCLLNMLLYIPLVSLVWINTRLFRQWNRYRRGRCPICGYDLRANFANGCSECGWRRATVANLESKSA